MASFGLGEYVVGENNLYECEGTIIGMHESTGSKKGMLYTIRETPGFEHCFFAEEITRLVMPRIYNHTLCEMAKEWFYLNGDKRIAKCDLFKNPTRVITSGRTDKNVIYLTFTAYKKSYTYFTTLDKIIDNFKNKKPSEYAHNVLFYQKRDKVLEELGMLVKC